MTELPETVWSGSFWLGDVEMKCHVLSTGDRIIEADSLAELFDGRNIDIDPKQMEDFSKWQKGVV